MLNSVEVAEEAVIIIAETETYSISYMTDNTVSTAHPLTLLKVHNLSIKHQETMLHNEIN